MAIQTINLGTYANDGTGDDLRTAFEKVKANFAELSDITAIGGVNLGSGTPVYAGMQSVTDTGDNLTFRSLVAGNNVLITNNATTVTIAGVDSINNLVEDTTPQLGGNLDLNGHIITSSSSFGINSNGGGIGILAINPANKNYNSIYLNGLELSGGNDDTGGEVSLSAFTGINLSINSDSGLTLYTVNNLSLTGNQILANGPIVSSDNITTTGNIYAFRFTGNLTGDTTGLHTGNVVGNVVGNVTGSTTGTHTGNVVGNVTGNTAGTHNGNVTGNVTGDVTGRLTGDVTGALVGDVYASNGTTKVLENGNGTNAIFTGTLNGDVTGALVGDVYASNGTTRILENGNGAGIVATFTGNTTGIHFGAVTGTVSDLSNHDIRDLNDVSSVAPTTGQALVWNGSIWTPGTVAGAGGGTLDFGTFTAPAGFTLDMGTF
jgi:hypothetical protein